MTGSRAGDGVRAATQSSGFATPRPERKGKVLISDITLLAEP